MLIRKLDPKSFVRAYNADLQEVYPWEGVVRPPYGAVWAVLRPGETSKSHAHQECESFFIASGRGRIKIGQEEALLEPGDVTFHRPFDEHELTNVSDTEDLFFLDVYWEQKELWTDPEGELAGEAAPVGRGPVTAEGVERVLVTSAAPTPNGDLHLGHLSGPYLCSDIVTRYLRLRGYDAHYGAGTDDNSWFVKSLSEEMGLTPQETADRFYREISETLEMAGVDRTLAPQPNKDEHHVAIVQECFTRLREKGLLEEREAPLPYCEACDLHLFEPYVRGRCAHCGGGVTGHTCEACGWYNDPSQLLDPECTRCGAAAGSRDVKRFFFPLGRFTRELQVHHRFTPSSPRFRAFCEHVLEEGAPDIAVTYPADWGVPVPVEGYEDQRMWSWFELGPRYFNYARLMAEQLGLDDGYQEYWRSPTSRIVRLIGFDNSFYDGLLLNAVYLAYDPDIRLPAAYIVNELYRLDGKKFSTSRNHRILGRDLLAVAPRDAVRYFLAFDGPEREETNFTLERFQDTVRRELDEGIQGWLTGLSARLAADFGGTVPATGDWIDYHRRYFHRLQEHLSAAAEGYQPESFSLHQVTDVIRDLVREARRFGQGERYWKLVETRSQENRTGIALELLAAKVLALIAAPIMPDFAGRLWQALGFDDGGPGDGSWDTALEWLEPGRELDSLDQDFFPGLGEYLEEERATA